jgi:putative transposase
MWIAREVDAEAGTSVIEMEVMPDHVHLSISEDPAVGIDVGLTHFATLSTGEPVENPRSFREAEDRLKPLQRRVSKAVRGSDNRRKRRRSLPREGGKLAYRRRDFQFKTARDPGQRFGRVAA